MGHASKISESRQQGTILITLQEQRTAHVGLKSILEDLVADVLEKS